MMCDFINYSTDYIVVWEQLKENIFGVAIWHLLFIKITKKNIETDFEIMYCSCYDTNVFFKNKNLI